MSNNNYLVEGLLRPPVEFYTTAVCIIMAVVCFYVPWAVALRPSVAYSIAIAFLVLASIRFYQGYKLVRYHRNLKRLKKFEMGSKTIPVGNKFLFLGKGFRWQPKHTQRLHDCFSATGEKYIFPNKLFSAAREFEKNHQYSFITKLTSKDTALNPFRPYPPVGGIPAIHGIELNEVNVTIPLDARVGHTMVLGTTRVGKTRLAEILVTQDILRGKTPEEREVVIFFDPKGDADILKRMYAEAKRAGRENEFYCFHLGYPETSARYNAIGRFNKITEVAGRISGQLSGDGNSAAFKEFAWRFVNIISRALVELGQRPNYQLIAKYVRSIDELFIDYSKFYFEKMGLNDDWIKVEEVAQSIDPKNVSFAMRGRSNIVVALDIYIREKHIDDSVLDGLLSAVRYDKTYFDKIVASLLPLLEKLTSGKVAELLSPDYNDLKDTRPIFDWETVIRKRGIVYVGLDALSDLTVASAVGNSMFADLVSMAGHIYKFGINDSLPSHIADKHEKIPINLYCDEFNELIGDEFIPLVNKGGGAGIQVTALSQTVSDILARIKDRAKAGQIVGNFNQLIMLRVKELETAEILTKNLHEVSILEVMATSATTDSSEVDSEQHFQSNTGDRVTVKQKPMLSPADIMNLPKGQAFALLEGSQLWKIRMPLPIKEKDDCMPKDLQEITASMQEQYSTTENWWTGVHSQFSLNNETVEAFKEISRNG